MLKKNIAFLKQYNNQLLTQLQNVKLGDSVKIAEAKNGQQTLFLVQDGRKQYIHSSYSPDREVEALIEKYKDKIHKGKPILFVGSGLGYHIEKFVKEFQPEWMAIVEFQLETLFHGLSNCSITEMKTKTKQISLANTEEDMINACYQLVHNGNQLPFIIVLPSYERIFKDQVQLFLEVYKKVLKNREDHYVTNISFQKRWTYNSLKNFTKLLKTPNLLADMDKSCFKDKPAILVSAGPSLNYEFDNLREIKQQQSAYIFSVGSAINALIENGIYPDAAFTYDPTELNQVVFKKVKEKKIHEIPLVFGSSVGFETLEDYPGELIHFITSQDFVSAYTIKHNELKEIDIADDAPSIAVISLQLLDVLGCNPIVIVGQNLAYHSNVRYASGIRYEHVKNELSEEERSSAVQVPSVTGEMILTNDGFIRMKDSMEVVLKNINDKTVINTTKNGAAIQYAEYIPLNEVMRSFKLNTVNKDWSISGKSNYDLNFVKQKWNILIEENEKLLEYIRSIKSYVNKIDKTVNKRELNKLNRLFIKLDQEVEKLLSMNYYKTFISSMVRFEYEIVSNELKEVRESGDLIKKAKVIVKQYERLINEWEISYRLIFEDVKSVYEEIKQL